MPATEATLREGAVDTTLLVVVPDVPTGTVNGTLIATIEGVAESYSREVSLRIVEAPGEPDRSFGQGGVVTTMMPNPAGNVRSRRAVTIDADGGLLIAQNSPSGGEVMRITPDGRRDDAFGSGARATLANFTVSGTVASPMGAVVVGQQGNNAAVARLDPTGNRIAGFGDSGVASRPPPPLTRRRTGTSSRDCRMADFWPAGARARRSRACSWSAS